MAEREHLLEQIAQQQQVIVDKQASADAAGDAAEEEEEPSKSPKSDTKGKCLAGRSVCETDFWWLEKYNDTSMSYQCRCGQLLQSTLYCASQQPDHALLFASDTSMEIVC